MNPTTTPPPSSRRPTRQRSALSALLSSHDDFLSAKEIYHLLVAGGESVSLATVYRNLQAMAADGEVDVLRMDESEARYRACQTRDHHHHLVCRLCSRTIEIEGPDGVEQWSTRVGADHGFRDLTHSLEIFGVCADH